MGNEKFIIEWKYSEEKLSEAEKWHHLKDATGQVDVFETRKDAENHVELLEILTRNEPDSDYEFQANYEFRIIKGIT